MKARFACKSFVVVGIFGSVCMLDAAALAFPNSYNIDIGPSGSPDGVPASSYGGAAAQTGTWNAIAPSASGQGLLDTSGVNQGVTITANGGYPAIHFNHGALTGNIASLLEDFHDSDAAGGAMTWNVGGLPAGAYQVYSYAFAPDGASFDTSINVLQATSGPQVIGGSYGGSLALGVTHALHEAIVSSNGQLTIVVSTSSGYASLNGLQIVAGPGGPPQPPQQATNPSPANNATGAAASSQVCWSNGGGATTYDVYFGTDSTPDSSELVGNQSGTCYDPPGSLAYSTTYYWRIDAKNGAGTTAGNVWSFTTMDAPPAPPAQATNPNPASGASSVAVSAAVSWANGGGASSYDVFFGTDSTPDSGEAQGNTASTSWDPPGNLAYSTTYYWRIDAKNAGGTTAGQVWSFTTAAAPPQPPAQAVNPNPASGSGNAAPSAQVCWANGGGATGFDVYFGIDSTPDADEFKGNQSATCYNPPGDLAYSTTYYWRIDATNSFGTTTGNVWSFTTQPPPVQIAGTVLLDGAGLAGVTISASNGGGTAITDIAGAYVLASIPSGWSGTVSPTLVGYDFSPSFYNYTNVTSNLAGQDFTAAVSTGTVVVYSGENPEDQYGSVVVALQDVDGDGVTDFAIAAPYYNADGNPDAGAVYIYSGQTGELLDSMGGEAPGDRYGLAIAGGDLTGDGYGELIIAAPYRDASGKTDAGKVYIYTWSNNDMVLISSKSGAAANDRFGWSLATGRFNSGSAAELVVGAPYHDAAGKNAGRVYVYDGASLSCIEKIDGDRKGDLFGHSLAGLGKADGDSKEDFVVGAPNNDANGKDSGRAYLYSGADMGDSGVPEPVWQPKGAKPSDQFGWSVAGVGDVDGDGNRDFAVGAPHYDASGKSSAGRVYVFSGDQGNTLWSRNGQSGGDQFGWSISGGFDYNDDGKDDLVCGPPRSDLAATDAGAISIRSGANGDHLTSMYTGEGSGDLFGSSVAMLGDVNGDGVADFVVGAPRNDASNNNAGRAYLYLSAGTAMATAPPDQDEETLSDEASDQASIAESTCPADCAGGDGLVNAADLLAVSTAIGQHNPALDVNADGEVDHDDVIAVLAAWGACPETQ